MNATPDTAIEIARLLEAIETLANPGCCRGQGKSTFRVMGRNGRPTGQEVVLCNGCGRELMRTLP